MNRIKKTGITTIIIIAMIIALIFTHSILPGFLRDKGGLHKSFEKAQMYLNDGEYNNILIEYDYAPGYAPSPTAIDIFENTLNKYCEKDEITHVIDDMISFEDLNTIYNEYDIYSIEREYQDELNKDDTVVLYVLYLGGLWKEEDVLGLSYGGQNIVLFKEKALQSADKSPNLFIEDIEGSVLIHEWGHLIGLVGIDYRADHESKEYKHHCNEEAGDCVMAASVEIVVGGTSTVPPTDFCPLCQEDFEEIKRMRDNVGAEEILTYISMAGEFSIGLIWTAAIIKKGKEKGYKDGEWKEYDVQYYDEDEKKYF